MKKANYFDNQIPFDVHHSLDRKINDQRTKQELMLLNIINVLMEKDNVQIQ